MRKQKLYKLNYANTEQLNTRCLMTEFGRWLLCSFNFTGYLLNRPIRLNTSTYVSGDALRLFGFRLNSRITRTRFCLDRFTRFSIDLWRALQNFALAYYNDLIR